MTQDTNGTTDAVGEQDGEVNAYVEFAAMVALALGLGTLGFGTGLHVSLMAVQSAVVDTTAMSLEMQAGPSLYQALLELQAWTNRSLYVAAVLLVGGGFLAERHRVREQVAGLAARLQSLEDGAGGDSDA